jgi:aldose 1-epimerase
MGTVNTPARPASVEIAANDYRVVVCPEVGGAIARCTWRGTELLRPAPESAFLERQVRQMACYPLVPYSNRIGKARLLFEGKVYALQENFAPEPHAIHGVGWRRPWRVESAPPSAVRLALAHAPDAHWPFRFEARQAISLGTGGLELRLAITNTDARRMPAGLGFHPFFALRPGARFAAEWQGRWVAGEDKLPARWEPVGPETDFRIARAVEHWKIDDCFTGWKRTAVLHDSSCRIRIEASEALDRLVCYAPADGRAFLAIEPVSHVNNAFALAASGTADTGMRVLAPGETWEVWMTIAAGEP